MADIRLLTPSLASYLAGLASLGVIAATLGFGGYQLRRWLAPGFTGALARLAELLLAISMLVIVLQAVGTLGLLRAEWIVGGCVVAGLAAAMLGVARATANGAARSVPAPRPPRWALLVAAGVASWTFAEWTFPTQLALDQGMFGGDSTWYHMPFSARFAQ